MKWTIKIVPKSVNFITACNYSIIKQSRLLKKLMDKELRHRTILEKQAPSIKFAQEIFPNPNFKFDRRIASINKVYMQSISELLHAQKHISQLIDLGIEFTKMDIFKNRSYINVYWISKNENLNVEEIQKIQKKAAGEMQKEVASLRFIGKPPHLRFVRDVYLESQIKVEKLLAYTDLGKNYEPSKPQKAFKASFVTEPCEKIPEMRQDVLGLEHDKIKGTILANIKKFRTIDLPEKKFDFENDIEVDQHKLIPFDKKTFIKFYKRRQILKKKMEKLVSHASTDNDDDQDYEDEYDDDDYEDVDDDDEDDEGYVENDNYTEN